MELTEYELYVFIPIIVVLGFVWMVSLQQILIQPTFISGKIDNPYYSHLFLVRLSNFWLTLFTLIHAICVIFDLVYKYYALFWLVWILGGLAGYLSIFSAYLIAKLALITLYQSKSFDTMTVPTWIPVLLNAQFMSFAITQLVCYVLVKVYDQIRWWYLYSVVRYANTGFAGLYISYCLIDLRYIVSMLSILCIYVYRC